MSQGVHPCLGVPWNSWQVVVCTIQYNLWMFSPLYVNNFKGGLTFIFYSSKSLQIHNIYLLHFLYVFCACHWESIRVWVCRGTRGRLWFAPFNTIFGCFPLYIWESIRVWVCRGTRGRLWFCTIQYNLWMFSPLYVCQTLLKNRVCQTFCQDINSLQIGSHKWQT
uniref:Uncharacterized protein LOC113787786 n=1 Tax=Cicer arietinum TaxID=3827 RepID=A0A3Q7YGV5_CICAR|nr:uncharacterized protein LOC113787786 [Cicer arietinum]